MESGKNQTRMIVVAALLFIALVYVVYTTFFTHPSLPPSPNPGGTETSVTELTPGVPTSVSPLASSLDLAILGDPRFTELTLFDLSRIELNEIGREDPFVDY
ncbi:MAG: hypothetical protein HY459_04325 [Parcubacteria group bacterium]|nr:hypothetical protein [Parcubacteria group bacterium]